MACGGAVQWFVIIPRLFAKPDSIVLNLQTPPRSQAVTSTDRGMDARTEVAASTAARAGGVETLEDLKVLDLQPEVSSKNKLNVMAPTKLRRKTINLIPPFDRKGRTPLERVISHL